MPKLSPIYNWATDINAIPANGAKLFCYAAGSSTKQTTYTDEAGTVPQANPIILNSRGEPASPIWLTEGLAYKFVFTSSTDSDPPVAPIRTIDDVTGVNDTSLTIDQWIDSGVVPTYVSTTSFTLPGDQTTAFHINRRLKFTVTAGTVYGYISNSVFGALTTVTVVLDSGSLDSGLSNVQLGLITAANTSMPKIADFVVTDMLSDSTQGFALINGTITATANTPANSLTIAIKTLAGADPTPLLPVLCMFRSSTLTSGTYVIRSITAATSLVISSGSTLGTASTLPSQINVLAIDNAGTVELAVVNRAGAVSLLEDALISTTAEGGAGAADSVNVIYSTTARINVPFRNISYFVSTQATAGTWLTAPSKIQLLNQWVNGNASVLGTPQVTTSGTAINFTSIPPWVKEVIITFVGVSTNGTNDLLVQIGGSGGIEASGYLSSAWSDNGAAGTNGTTGFIVTGGLAAASVVHGAIALTLHNPVTNTWVSTGTLGQSNAANVQSSAGSRSNLTTPLENVRITSVGSVNTFDAGSIGILWK